MRDGRLARPPQGEVRRARRLESRHDDVLAEPLVERIEALHGQAEPARILGRRTVDDLMTS
jgi:hypothetical protein